MEYQLAGIQNIALYTLDKNKAYEFVHQTIRRLGVGQVTGESQALGQVTPTPTPGHGTAVGHGHMAPPKAKGGASKWFGIAAAVAAFGIAGFFITKGGSDTQSAASQSTPATTSNTRQATDGSHRIALLPFEVNAAKEEDKWVSGGMDNELKTAINKIDGVTIIAGLSVNGYRGANREISKIKSNLNVDYILDGSITVTGGKTSLNLDFIKADDLSTIWSETIQATPDTVFDSKIQIATKLASSLNIQLGAKTSEAIGTKHTENAEAFRLYTQGRELWMTRSQAGMKQSIKLYEQAIELDNKFALTYSGIADAYSMMAVYGFMDIHTAYPKARKYVLDAISRNPALPEAYISLGWIQFAYEWKLKDSEENYKKAIDLNPKIAQGHQWLGINLQTQGKHAEAYSTLKRGLELDPNHHVLLTNINETCNSLGKFDEAKQYAIKSREAEPLFYNSWFMLYKTYIFSKENPKVIEELINEIEGLVNKDQPIYLILTHYYWKTDRKKAELFYERSEELDKTAGNSLLQNREVLTVGIDNFIRSAEQAFENNTLDYAIESDLFLLEYQDHPAFQSFIKKVRRGK
jgi:TolB-like protein/TPR repeat protein